MSLHHSFVDDMYLYLLMELLPGMCAHAMHDCACSPHSPHHRTPHTGGHLGCMMDSYDIPEHWAVFYIAEAITAINVIHKVQ